MLVVSPHLDDAVLGCGRLLAAHPGSVVATVFAGVPRDRARRTDWDAQCGFASAEQAIETRRREDRAALVHLNATPVWLDFCDSQYGETPAVDAVREVLHRLIADLRPQMVLFPLGLFHSDHLLVHEASRAALAAHRGIQGIAYEDVLYRGMPGLLQQRLVGFASARIRATPARLDAEDGSPGLKAEALLAYSSQLHAFGEGGIDDASQPERFWLLEAAVDVDGR
jgi:LmbE family N-acetylglucosaminyl deacetylase